MTDVLAIVEATGKSASGAGELRKTSLGGISFAQALAKKTGGKVHLAVVGHQIDAAIAQLRAFGAEKVWQVDDAAFAHLLAENTTLAIAAIAKACGASRIAMAASSTAKDVMPRVAARLQAGMASDVLSVEGPSTYKRPMWAGNVVATVEITSPTQVMTVRSTEFPPPAAGPQSPVEKLAVAVDAAALKTHFVGLKEVKSERPDVATADRIVSGGRGVKGAEGFKVIEQLADAIGAGVGASRAVCDAGWVPNDLQIGQTGKIVAPNLYIACGISGAIQHLAGMKGSKIIVAINKDPEAPIFQVADFGLVADLFAAVPEMVQSLKT